MWKKLDQIGGNNRFKLAKKAKNYWTGLVFSEENNLHSVNKVLVLITIPRTSSFIMIVFVLLPVKSSRSLFGIRALVLLLFIIYDCKNVRWMPHIFLFRWFFLNHEAFQVSAEFLVYETNMKKLRWSRKIECNNSLQLAKVIKIKSKKNKTGLIYFMLICWNKE